MSNPNQTGREAMTGLLTACAIVLAVGTPLMLSIASDFECTKRTDAGQCVTYTRKP